MKLGPTLLSGALILVVMAVPVQADPHTQTGPGPGQVCSGSYPDWHTSAYKVWYDGGSNTVFQFTANSPPSGGGFRGETDWANLDPLCTLLEAIYDCVGLDDGYTFIHMACPVTPPPSGPAPDRLLAPWDSPVQTNNFSFAVGQA